MSFDFTHRDAANDAIEHSRRRNATALDEVQRTWDEGAPRIAGAVIVSPAQAAVLKRLDRRVLRSGQAKPPEPHPLPSRDEALAAYIEAGGDPADFEAWWRGG